MTSCQNFLAFLKDETLQEVFFFFIVHGQFFRRLQNSIIDSIFNTSSHPLKTNFPLALWSNIVSGHKVRSRPNITNVSISGHVVQFVQVSSSPYLYSSVSVEKTKAVLVRQHPRQGDSGVRADDVRINPFFQHLSDNPSKIARHC